jgi:hypothetical protein
MDFAVFPAAICQGLPDRGAKASSKRLMGYREWGWVSHSHGNNWLGKTKGAVDLFRHCERSEAIQLRIHRSHYGLLRRFASRNDVRTNKSTAPGHLRASD